MFAEVGEHHTHGEIAFVSAGCGCAVFGYCAQGFRESVAQSAEEAVFQLCGVGDAGLCEGVAFGLQE
ncbi:hypothetical protein ABZ848_48130, partial [Streptomyces sp. NPDC047081]|uniref:hypothetical protein n=1 Tax=Streptomyces sp. NPDC047081 TaxID=3154706 RepID=UPI00340620C4